MPKRRLRLQPGLAMIPVVCIALAMPVHALDLYVSPSGDDANPGSAQEPFATAQRARDEIRARKRAGTLSGVATVRFGGGTYPISEPLLLNSQDSGTPASPIVYAAAENSTPRFCAAQLPGVSDFQPVTDPRTLDRLSPGARSCVLQLDLQKLDIRHAQRYPDLFVESGGIIDLYFQGERMPLARFPNTGTMAMKRVLHNTGTSPGEGGIFQYQETYAAEHERWHSQLQRGVWLKGYWRVPWQIEAVRVKSIDTDRHTVTMAQSVPGGIGSKYHRPEGSGAEPYWLLNLLEELDRPGEWCIDFNSQTLYFWPPGILAPGSVLIADMAAPLVTFDSVSHVSLRGLILEGGLGAAVEISGGESVDVARCEIRNCGRDGVVVTGGYRHTVTECEIHDLGGSGVLLYGGDRGSLVPSGHAAVNNHIHHYGQVQLVYAAGVNVGCRGTGRDTAAVGIRVAHNSIHDAPHVGILYGGNDHLLEYNEVYRVCLVSNDMGGFYTVGDWTSRGNIVRWNLVHDSPNANGIYCDDGDSGDQIYGNLLYGLDAGVFIGGGHDNHVTGNVIANCRHGIHIDARGVARGYNLDNRRMVEAVTSAKPQLPPWSERYPALAQILDFHPELPTGNRFASNVILQCGRAIDRAATEAELRFTQFETNLELPDAAEYSSVEQRRGPGKTAESPTGTGDAQPLAVLAALKAFVEEQQDSWSTLPEFNPIPLKSFGLAAREEKIP